VNASSGDPLRDRHSATIIKQLVEFLDADPRGQATPASEALAETLRLHHAC